MQLLCLYEYLGKLKVDVHLKISMGCWLAHLSPSRAAPAHVNRIQPWPHIFPRHAYCVPVDKCEESGINTKHSVGRVFLLCFTLQNTPASWKKSYDKPKQHIKKQRRYFTDKGFSSSHVWIWELDRKEGWVTKNWCFWTMVLEKTLESPLNCKEIKPVNPKGN